MLEDKLHKLG